MLKTIVRRFYRARYFPRLVVQQLGDIARETDALSIEVRRLGEKRSTGQRSLADIQNELSGLCDGVTRLIVQERRRSDAAATELQQLERTLQRFGDALSGITDALRADLDGVRTSIAELNGELPALRQAAGRDAAALENAVDAQNARIAALDRAVRQLVSVFPSWPWSTDTAREVRETLSLLRPVAVAGHAMIRLGRDLDGGYVMLDDLGTVAAALSLGIADDVSWDLDVAARNIRVLQFDPSVTGSPVAHPSFAFEPLRVVPSGTRNGITIDDIVSDRLHGVQGPLLLKIDIEGAEWDVFDALGSDTLRRFKQIVCEFHDLDRLAEPEFGARARAVWSKLAATHHVVHVHGNNCGNFANVANAVVPQSLEVTYASRDAYAASGDAGRFPTALDRPNQPGRADLFLGSFRFDDVAEPPAPEPARPAAQRTDEAA